MNGFVKGLLLVAAISLVCSWDDAFGHWPSYGCAYYAPRPIPYPFHGVFYGRPVVVGPGPVFYGPPIGMRPFIINPLGQGYRPVYVQPYRVWHGPYVW